MLAPGDFFASLRTRLKATLPATLKSFHSSRGRGHLMKVHYGEPAFHFEIWHHTGDGRLEVGLHFEGPSEQNSLALDYFRQRMIEIKASLPRAELEPWDRGWSRLYETIPAARLDERAAASGASLAAAYVVALEPLLEDFLNQ